MACEYAELHVYDVTGTIPKATIPVSGLGWSDEVGGGGSVSFTASAAALASVDVLSDCVVKVAAPLATSTPTEFAAFAVRGYSQDRLKARTVTASGVSLLTAWGSDAVIRPEFAGADMPRAAGEQRGLSWVSSAYDPATDADEPWALLDVSARVTLPTDPAFPAGSGADWITATTAAAGDRKMFRAWLTITTDNTLIRAYFSSDETATLWVGGEELIQTDDVEVGKKNTHKADRVFMAGVYAVAVDTVTHISKGGDGVDPILVAIAELDDDGDVSSWLLVSDSSWVATRRPITGPGSAPPGPTPGALIGMLADEAADRGVTTWVGLTRDFTAALDSDGVAWTTTEERIARYGFDSYLTTFDGLGDVACDMRITPGLVLQARGFEGSDLSTGASPVTLRGAVNAATLGETVRPVVGNVADAYTVDGWITVSDSGSVGTVGRREFALSLGSAPSLSQGERVATEALAEFSTQRWDWTIEFVARPGAVPYEDFRPGDTVRLEVSQGVYTPVRVLSLGGSNTSPITWTAELGEGNK